MSKRTEDSVARRVRDMVEDAGCEETVRVLRVETRTKHFQVVLEGPRGQARLTLSHGPASWKRLQERGRARDWNRALIQSIA